VVDRDSILPREVARLQVALQKPLYSRTGHCESMNKSRYND